MVQQLFAALDGLREFEQRNGINSLGLEHLLGAKNDPQKFAEWWCLNIFQPSENSITRRFYVRGNAYL